MGCDWAQYWHWKSANSTMLMTASGAPRVIPSRVTGRRSTAARFAGGGVDARGGGGVEALRQDPTDSADSSTSTAAFCMGPDASEAVLHRQARTTLGTQL